MSSNTSKTNNRGTLKKASVFSRMFAGKKLLPNSAKGVGGYVGEKSVDLGGYISDKSANLGKKAVNMGRKAVNSAGRMKNGVVQGYKKLEEGVSRQIDDIAARTDKATQLRREKDLAVFIDGTYTELSKLHHQLVKMYSKEVTNGKSKNPLQSMANVDFKAITEAIVARIIGEKGGFSNASRDYLRNVQNSRNKARGQNASTVVTRVLKDKFGSSAVVGRRVQSVQDQKSNAIRRSNSASSMHGVPPAPLGRSQTMSVRLPAPLARNQTMLALPPAPSQSARRNQNMQIVAANNKINMNLNAQSNYERLLKDEEKKIANIADNINFYEKKANMHPEDRKNILQRMRDRHSQHKQRYEYIKKAKSMYKR